MRKIVITLLISFSFTAVAQRSYKQLMNDPSVNFYEVCAAADAYFETVDKEKKGSGWKGYQRWKYANESKYYPSGDRSNVDPYLVSKSYENLKSGAISMDKALFPDGWIEVGPVAIDSITGHYSPGLGRIETFYVDPVDEDIMYFGSRSGGFWKTTDAGASWTGGSTDFLFATGVNSIAVSPTNPDSILINIRNSGNGTTHGIYRSIDGGENWVETDYNPVELGKGGLGSNFRINRVAYHPTVADLIFVAASDGLYRSDDNLDTWVKVTNGSISDIEFHPTNADIIYIYDYYYWGPNKNKVLRSVDGGVSFVGSAEIVGNSNNTSVQLDVSPICENCVYFASGNGLWKSFDSGLTYEFVASSGEGSQGFAVSDLDTTKMTIGYLDGYSSDDGGTTFEKRTWWSLGSVDFDGDQYIHADLREAECINGVFYVATDGYFAKSEDNGISWERLNDNTGIRENYTLGASQSDYYTTIVGSQDNGTSIKNQDGWIEFWGADGMEGIIHPLNADWMIGSNQYGGRRRTFNGGLTQGGASPPGHSSGWVAPLVYDPNDHMTVYHFGEEVHKSENFGNSWIVTGAPSFSGTISEAAIAENNSDIIIVSRGEYIERSTDAGVTFVDIKGTLPNYSITDIAFDPNDDNTFVITYNRHHDDGQKIFITHDMGDSWTNITANLNDMPIRGAVIDHSDASNIYLAAEIGVYVKAMADTDWELYNTDLPNCMIYELEVVNGSNALRAATWGRGVWEYTLKDRGDYPAILTTRISDQPTFETPKESVEQFVTSTIHYDGTVSEAFVKWSVDEAIFDNTIAMENISDTTWRTITEIPNFSEGTKVFFKVFAVGEVDDTTETYKFMYDIREFEYCDATGSPGTGSDYIDFVELEDLTNPSGQDYYGDFTDMTVNLFLDSTYTIQIGLNYHFDPDVAGAWIDYNANALFEDEEYITMSDYDGAHQSFGTFTVPSTAVLEDTLRMRTRNVWSSEMEPCGSIFGEVEDYSVVISCAKSYASISVGDCESYTSPSGAYVWTESGVYTDTLVNATGCDSIITIDFSVLTNGSTLSIESCGSYTSPSGDHVWETSGTYSDVLTNAAGCDSVLTINLDVLEATTSSIDVTACDTYLSPSGDFVWTSSGTYSDIIMNEAGCDSTITIELIIEDLNTAVTVVDYTLTAEEIGVSYQWLDCNAGWDEIDGATESSYSPLVDGSYAVLLTSDVCTDTSECFDIVGLSVNENAFGMLQLYPNPTSGEFILKFDENQPFFQLAVHDVAGKLVYNNTYENRVEVRVDLNVATGIYYLQLMDANNEEIMIKLVVD